MKKQVFVAIVLAGLVIGVLAFVKYRQIAEAIAQSEGRVQPPEAVTTFKAVSERWPHIHSAVGSVAPVQGAILSAEETGRVSKIDFESGALVEKGQLLVELDVSVEEAQLKGAIALRDLAVLTFERQKELRGRNANSISDLDNADASYRAAAAEVARLQAQIARKRITAPFAGQTGIRLVNAGEVIAAGTQIVSLQSFDALYVNFSHPQQIIGDFAVGNAVEVTVDAFPGQVFRGTLTAINPDIEIATRSAKLQATVPNKERKLRPGMFVDISIILPDEEPVITIPASSISFAPYGDTVFVVEQLKDPQGRDYLGVRQQIVKLARRRGDQIAVASGLKEGEEVVSSGTFKLRQGAAVQVNNSVLPGNDPSPNPADT